MSPTLPVPSKGALRALRRIALGTSCTVAFGAGLITEDRRRRIHSAREVHNNGLRLRASKQYRSRTQGSITDIFDEQSIRHVDNLLINGGWDPESDDEDSWSQKPPQIPVRTGRSPKRIQKTESDSCSTTSNSVEILPRVNVPVESTRSLIEHPVIHIMNRQRYTANQVRRIISNEGGLDAVAAAVDVLLRLFSGDANIVKLGRPLLEACARLFELCQGPPAYSLYTPVLQNIVELGQIEEEIGSQLGISRISSYLLEKSGFGSTNMPVKNLEMLMQATRLYMTKFTSTTSSMSLEMYKLGYQLVKALRSAQRFDTVVTVFWFMIKRRGEFSIEKVDTLIMAECANRNYKKALRAFFLLFPSSHPSQEEFYDAVGLAVDAALHSNDIKAAEEVIRQATSMTASSNLVLSTSKILQIFSHQWAQDRNIETFLNLFHRLEFSFQYTGHPQALFSAAIKHALESGAEIDAMKLADTSVSIFGTLDLVTRGHFTLSKARKDDWNGVQADFDLMLSYSQVDRSAHLCSIFVAVLKEHASKHSTKQMENMLSTYIDHYGIEPNLELSNAVVESYARVGEIDSISTWLEFVRPSGLAIDSTTFNSILTTLKMKWHVPLDRLVKLCSQIRLKSPTLFDDRTVNILRGAITSRHRSHSSKTTSWLRKIDALVALRAPQDSGNSSSQPTLQTRMSDALSKNVPELCLRLFKHGFSRNNESVLNSPQVVALAIEACIRAAQPDYLEAAARILRDAKNRGVDVTLAMTPLILHQIADDSTSLDEVDRIINATLVSLAQRKLSFPVSAASKIASILVDRGSDRMAISVWTSLWKFNSHSPAKMNLVSLTVLLKAYLRLNDLDGVWWVMTIIVQNKIVPDTLFKQYLKNERRLKSHWLDAHPQDYKARSQYELIEKSWQLTKALRAEGRLDAEATVRKTLLITELAALEERRAMAKPLRKPRLREAHDNNEVA